MSSRGDFLSSGPVSGVYTPKPTPQNPEEIPVYLNDELLDLGGRLNNVMEGGVLPPQTKLPKRVREPMIIYFTQPVKDDNGNLVIDSAGVWLYRKEKWWKLIDDPSATNRTLQVYMLAPKHAPAPERPQRNKWLAADVEPWSYTPFNVDPENDLWTSVAPNAVTGEIPDVNWSEPIILNKDVVKGDQGEVGYSIEFRYLAATLKPVIEDKKAVIPKSLTGEEFTTTIPGVDHPNRSYIWSTYCYFRDDNDRGEWSDPVKFSTPDSTKTKDAYAIGEKTYPTFDPNGNPMPGPEWMSEVPSDIPKGWSLWRSNRLEWSDGTAQTMWTTPYRANGEIGNIQESRYISSTNKPDISDKFERDPKTTSGRSYTRTIPEVVHPDNSYVWITTATINALDEVELAWTNPSKFSTPDTTFEVNTYIATDGSFPIFDPQGHPLPGEGWSKEIPSNIQKGWTLWRSTRLEWSDGSPQTPWTTPYRANGEIGNTQLTMYLASTDQPVIRNLSERVPYTVDGEEFSVGHPPVSHPDKSYIWATTATINALDEVEIKWTQPAKIATPDNTFEKTAYITTDGGNPVFNPTGNPLPGIGWSETVPTNIQKGWTLWRSNRLEWEDGTGITEWSTPYRANGEIANKQETRYVASTSQPIIRNSTERVPHTPGGVPYPLSHPATSHPDKSFIWATTATINALDELEVIWTKPAKVATPDNTSEVVAYITTGGENPPFNPQGHPLPGTGWSYDIPSDTGDGKALWRSNRLEWPDGTGVTSWSTPYKASGERGLTQETRYIASTDKPNIANTSSRDPKTSSGLAFTKELPPTSHPSKSFIWSTVATVDSEDNIFIPWTDPSKLATPDSTKSVTMYCRGFLTTYQAFDPNAEGSPGLGWSTNSPSITADQYIWSTTRLEWSDGTKQTPWSTPTRLTGTVGVKVEFRYKASTNQPALDSTSRNPAGWSKVVPEVTTSNQHVWVTQADIGASDNLIGQWSTPAKHSSPKTSQYVMSYAVGTDTGYPSFVNTGSPNPGSSWSREVPTAPAGKRVWATTRFEFSRSEGLTPWETPFLFTGKDGSDGKDGSSGADGNDGLTVVSVYKNSGSRPANIASAERAYPPSGWSKVPTNPPSGQVTWVSHSIVVGDPGVATRTTQEYSSVSQFSGTQGVKGDKGDKGIPGVTYYTWVKYADNASGGGMSDSPVGKKYLGLAYNKTTPTESTSAGDYQWSRIEGDQGVPGPKGNDGESLYTWVKYADTSTGGGMSDSPVGKKYMGIAINKTTPTESNTASDYTWAKVEGDQGIPGSPGKDGVTLYTWVKYADTAAGGGMSDSPVNKKYLGLAYNKTSQTESTNPALYQWSKVEGDQGVPGQKGDDGQQLYTWVKYADNASGSGMSDSPTGKKYLGLAYNKTTPTESTNPALYQWSKVEGDKGVPGTNGKDGVDGKDGTDGKDGADGNDFDQNLITRGSPGNKWVVGKNLPFGDWLVHSNPTQMINMATPSLTGGAVLRCDGTGAGASGGAQVNRVLSTSQSYRFSVWVYQDDPKTNGRVYMGSNSSLLRASNGTSDTNPYFVYTSTAYAPNLKPKRWYLLVGVIHKHGTPLGTDSGLTGWYDSETGEKVGRGVDDFIFPAAGNRTTLLRFFRYAATDASKKTYFYNPRIDMLDGNHISLNSLLPQKPSTPGVGFFSKAVTGYASWPSDQAADDLFISVANRVPQINDVLTLYNPANSLVSHTKSKSATGAWVTPANLLHGTQIVRGTIIADNIAANTITGDKIAANTIHGDKITAGTVNGNRLVARTIQGDRIVAGTTISSPVVSAGTLNGGSINIGNGVFTVNTAGALVATNANIRGAVTATSGTFTGTVSGSTISGGTINIGGGKFQVNSSGVMTCTGASIGGTLKGANGTFAGTLSSANGTFKGTVSAGSILGGTIDIGNGKFKVDSAGTMTCTGASIGGSLNGVGGTFTGTLSSANGTFRGTVSAGTISGGSINIGSGKFKVDTNGTLTCTGANIGGTLNSVGGTFTGSLSGVNGTFKGTVSAGTISGGTIDIGNGKFKVNSAGTMTCTGASIGGSLNGVGGTFTGTLSSVNGTFNGTVSAGTVTGSTITGGSIRVPATGTAKFTVDSAGNMVCNTAKVMNPSVTGGSLVGSSIHVPSVTNYKFRVNSTGDVTIRSAASGSRLEISGDQIKVYDGNTLRVVLGRL